MVTRGFVISKHVFGGGTLRSIDWTFLDDFCVSRDVGTNTKCDDYTEGTLSNP